METLDVYIRLRQLYLETGKAGNVSSSGIVNLRAGPGVFNTKVGELLPGDRVKVFETKSGWYRIDTVCPVWIKASLVQLG